MLILIPTISALIYVDDNQVNRIYNSGAYSMKIKQHNAFISDSYDDKQLLMTIRAVEGGFNLYFHCMKDQLDINPFPNELTIIYKRNTLHTNHMVHITIELQGGALDDVSLDQVEESSDYYTIVRIRLIGNDETVAERSNLFV